MDPKKTIINCLLVMASVAAIAGTTDKTFLEQKVDDWFKEAKPVDKGLFVTDRQGCLYGVTDTGSGLRVVQMLDDSKKPLCRK